MKILLGDPRHNTVGAHSYFVPIGIGYIGSHLLKQLHDKNIELKLSTNSKEIFNIYSRKIIQNISCSFKKSSYRSNKFKFL